MKCKVCGREIEKARGAGRPRTVCEGCSSAYRKATKSAICPICNALMSPRSSVCRRCKKQSTALKRSANANKCVSCGKDISGAATRCRQCYGVTRRKRSQYTCLGCGRVFYKGSSDNDAHKYCSRECSFRHRGNKVTCEVCGSSKGPTGQCKRCYPPRDTRRECCECNQLHKRSSKYCSALCHSIAKLMAGYRYVGNQWLHYTLKRGVKTCSVCDARIEVGSHYRASMYTCNKCVRRAARKVREHRKRTQTKTGDVITIDRLFARDNGRCCICGCSVHVVRGFHRSPANMATIGHCIALSVGGVHEWGNVMLECFMCNSLKGACEHYPSPTSDVGIGDDNLPHPGVRRFDGTC